MKRSLAGIVALIVMLPASCGLRPERVTIGVALSPTFHPGIELATQEINAAGGIKGAPLELVGLDFVNVFDRDEIQRWAQRFTKTEGLVAVIGHSDSASTLSAAAFYNQAGVPQIVTTATNPAITNIGKWTYRLCLSDAAQGPALAEYAVKDWGKKTIAVFYVNDDYGRGLAQSFERRVRELGGTIVASVMHRNTLTDDDHDLIRTRLSLMKTAGAPDLVVLFQRELAAEWTIGAVREAGLNADVMGGDSLSTARFLDRDPAAKEGIRVSHFFVPLPDNRRAADFMRNYRLVAGREPDYGSAMAYDAVFLLRDAILNGGPTREGVRSHLERLIEDKTALEGVAGTYTLGPDHDARRSFHIAEIHDGAFGRLKTLTIH